jgi:hypothetical protein
MLRPARIIRTLLATVATLVIILIIAVVAIFWYVDSLARRGVEAGGTYALGVDTTVRSVSIGLFRGTIEVDGLNIANPEGFEAPTFLTLEDGRTTVALRSLMQDMVRIPRLHFTDVDVTLLRLPDGRANYRVILDNLERLSRPETPRRAPDEPRQTYTINELIIRNITVHADIAPPIIQDVTGQPTAATVTIPEIRLQDVGPDGITLSELASILIEAILAAAIQHGGDILPPDLIGDLRARLVELGNLERLTATVDDLTAELEGIRTPDDVRDIIRDAPGRLRDIIPRRNDDGGN